MTLLLTTYPRENGDAEFVSSRKYPVTPEFGGSPPIRADAPFGMQEP